MEMMTLEFLSFADFDDFTLMNFLEVLHGIDWIRKADRLTQNRYRGMVNAVKWCIEGEGI